MARKTPKVTDTRLTFFDEYKEADIFVLDIVTDWQNWQDWLEQEQHKNFRFISADNKSFSVFKEYRPSFGRSDMLIPLWYAQKRVMGTLRKKYLGSSENVTHRKLTETANYLNMSQGWWEKRKEKQKQG